MELVIIVLNKEEYLETILSALIEFEVTDATILDGERLGQFLARAVPIFAGLRQLTEEKKTACKVITALINNGNFLSDFNKLLMEENIDFTDEGTGVILAVPVNKFIKSPIAD